MGLSLRAYGKHRGVSEGAVRKAVKTGRIKLEKDGTIDPVKADLLWSASTDPAKQRSATAEDIPSAATTTPGIPSNYLQAKTANEVLKAQTAKIKLEKLKGELVNKKEIRALVFKLARTERDAWVNWPARVAALMAAELGVDEHKMHMVLENYIRKHLEELSDIAFD